MRSNLGFIASRIPVNLAESDTDVRVRWREWPANTPVDPVTGELGTPEEMTTTVKAFLHFPTVTGNSEVKQFNEIELGDCIADFAADVVLDGKEGVSFEFLDRAGNPFGGHRWVPKPISQRLAQSWGVVAQGVRLFRPVLLRKA